MTKKQLIEMLNNVPDDATILIYDTDWNEEPVSCYTDNADGTVTLYSGDTD